jgi:hypothetical protein
MNAVDEIQTAIVRLSSWHGVKVAADIEASLLAEAQVGQQNARDVVGIIVLSSDRTIDAQLAILQRAAEAVRSGNELGFGHLVEHGNVHDLAFALARAINGDA